MRCQHDQSPVSSTTRVISTLNTCSSLRCNSAAALPPLLCKNAYHATTSRFQSAIHAWKTSFNIMKMTLFT